MKKARRDTPSRWTYLAVVLAASIGMFAGFAPVFNSTAGIFFGPVSHEFGLSRADASLSYAASMLGLALVSPLVGRLMDRYGVKRVIGVAIVLFAASVASMSLQNGSKLMWAGISLIVGITGAATSVLGYLAVLPQWFDKRLGLAVGIAMCGLGAGAIVMPSLTQALVSALGWRTAYVVLGGGSLLLSVPAWLLIKERRTQLDKDLAHAHGHAYRRSFAAALRSWRLWAIFSIFVLASAATLSFGPHLPSMLVGKGFAAMDAARSASTVGAGLLVGRILTGVLIDRIHAPFVACGFFVAGAVGTYLIRVSDTYPLLLAACFLVGLTIGAEGDMIAYLIRSYFGLDAFGSLFGIAFAGYGLGAVAGPIVVGIYFDNTGSYAMPLAIMPVLLALAAGLALSLGRYRPLVEPRDHESGTHIDSDDLTVASPLRKSVSPAQ
nr:MULTISPECIES: MFS transporter [unclassified Variovorax]